VTLLAASTAFAERVNAGLARAKEKGIVLGRRKVKPAVEDRITPAPRAALFK
jgi:hypothetical protein